MGLSIEGSWASPVVLVVKNLPANAGDLRDIGLIPGLETSPGGNLLEKFHGQKSLAGYSSYGCKESDMTKAT